VDAFSHHPDAEGAAMTTVNFKGYTQTIPDAEMRLFNFLLARLKPHHESH